MWRPPGWKKLDPQGEAGADAMLVALRSLPDNSLGKRVKKCFPKPPPKGGEIYGWLIHIPDELRV